MRILLIALILVIAKNTGTCQSHDEKIKILQAATVLKTNEFKRSHELLKAIDKHPPSRHRKYYLLYSYSLGKVVVKQNLLTIKDSVKIRKLIDQLIGASEIYKGFWKSRQRKFQKKYAVNNDSIQWVIQNLQAILDSKFNNLYEKKKNYENLVDSFADGSINVIKEFESNNPGAPTSQYRLTAKRAGPNGEDLIVNFRTFYDSTFGNIEKGKYKNAPTENALLILAGILKNQAQQQVKVRGSIIGVADSTTPNPKKVKYGNEWGPINYHSKDFSIKIAQSQSLNNIELAFLRAYFAQSILNITLSEYKPESYVIELRPLFIDYTEGSQFRRIDVELYLYNWWLQNYEDLPPEIKEGITPDTREIVIENGFRVR